MNEFRRELLIKMHQHNIVWLLTVAPKICSKEYIEDAIEYEYSILYFHLGVDVTLLF